jgi:hypothetical protein
MMEIEKGNTATMAPLLPVAPKDYMANMDAMQQAAMQQAAMQQAAMQQAAMQQAAMQQAAIQQVKHFHLLSTPFLRLLWATWATWAILVPQNR